MRECLEQMGGVTRKEFLIQRLTVWEGVKNDGNLIFLTPSLKDIK